MGSATPAAVRKQIATGNPDPLYVLLGDDDVEKSALAAEFTELVDEGLRAFNVERVHAGDWTTGDALLKGVESIVEAVRTLPMMVPRRIVCVFQAEALLVPKRESQAGVRAGELLDALLGAPVPQTTLVLVSASIDKRRTIYKTLQKQATIVQCGAPEDVAGAERWVRARVAAGGVDIDSAAARLLGQRAGFPPRADPKNPHGDIGRLRGEVDRLLLYTLGQKKVSLEDAREMAGPAALQDDWAMTNAIEGGQTGEALRQLALMFDGGVPAPLILGQLGGMVRRKFPTVAPAEVEPAVDALFRTDLDLKRSAGDPRVLLERLVVELCAGGRTGAGPRPW